VLGQRFYVMERVDGIVPSDNPPFADPLTARRDQSIRVSIS
jgi:hypothetical protein